MPRSSISWCWSSRSSRPATRGGGTIIWARPWWRRWTAPTTSTSRWAATTSTDRLDEDRTAAPNRAAGPSLVRRTSHPAGHLGLRVQPHVGVRAQAGLPGAAAGRITRAPLVLLGPQAAVGYARLRH